MLQRISCALLAWLLMLTCIPAVSADSPAVISAISFPNDTAVAEENLSVSGFGDKDSGYAPSLGNGRIYASVSGTDLRKLEWSKGEYEGVGMQPVMTGGTKNPWGSGAYLETQLSTQGFTGVTFSASLGATKKGPRDYKLQFSTDGVTYTDVAGQAFSLPANKTMYPAFDSVALPSTADNVDTLYIRIAVASNMTVGGTAGLIGSTGGETAINNITVCGTPIAAEVTTIAATSSTESSTAVVEGDTTAIVPTTTTVPQVTSATRAVESADTGEDVHGVWIALILILSGVCLTAYARRRHA